MCCSSHWPVQGSSCFGWLRLPCAQAQVALLVTALVSVQQRHCSQTHKHLWQAPPVCWPYRAAPKSPMAKYTVSATPALAAGSNIVCETCCFSNQARNTCHALQSKKLVHGPCAQVDKAPTAAQVDITVVARAAKLTKQGCMHGLLHDLNAHTALRHLPQQRHHHRLHAGQHKRTLGHDHTAVTIQAHSTARPMTASRPTQQGPGTADTAC